MLRDRALRPKLLGMLFAVIFTIWEHLPFLPEKYAETASLASLAQSGSRVITSDTLAAAMCDAEEPCSVNAAQDPASSFTASPRNTTRPLYFWNFLSNSEFLRWHKSMSITNEVFLPLFALSRCFLFFTLDVHILFSLPPSLAEFALHSKKVSADETNEKTHRIVSTSCNMLFVLVFAAFIDTATSRFVSVNFCEHELFLILSRLWCMRSPPAVFLHEVPSGWLT